MKKMLFAIAIAFGLSYSIEIPDSLLTRDQRAYIEVNKNVEDAKSTKEVATSYIGIGKEIGVAVKESMSAITDETNKLAGTQVGHLLIFVILYKLLSSLVLSLIATIVTLIVVWTFFPLLCFFLYKYWAKDNNTTYKEIWASITITGFVIAIVISLVSVWNIR